MGLIWKRFDYLIGLFGCMVGGVLVVSGSKILTCGGVRLAKLFKDSHFSS